MSGRGPKVGPSNPERGISRRSFLKSVGIGLGLAGIGGLGGLGLAEHNAREKHKAVTAKLLEGTTLVEKIRGIQIYVDNSLPEDSPLLQEVIESLKPIISILPNEMVKRMRFIRLKTFLNNSTLPVPFEGEGHVDVGIELEIYPNRFKNFIYPNRFENGIPPQIEDRLAEVIFHEGVHSITFGDPDELSRFLRNHKLRQCQYSLKECISSLTDLIDEQSLEEWFRISEENDGYVSNELIPPDQIRQAGLSGKPNFGYILDDPNIRYGRLNLAEDIACVFEKILSSLYKVIHREEDPKAVISDLLSKTPGETGLYEKYLIACKSLTEWYEESSDQRKILGEFIQIIEDAIIIAKGTTNGQSTQTSQGVIEPQKTTGVQETPLGRLMRRRLDEIRKSGRQGPS